MGKPLILELINIEKRIHSILQTKNTKEWKELSRIGDCISTELDRHAVDAEGVIRRKLVIGKAKEDLKAVGY